MTRSAASRRSADPEARLKPSDAKVIELLDEARRQYEEVMRLADLADLPDRRAAAPETRPAYSWDNPIGYVVTGSSDGDVG